MCSIQAPCDILWAFFFKAHFFLETYLRMFTLHTNLPMVFPPLLFIPIWSYFFHCAKATTIVVFTQVFTIFIPQYDVDLVLNTHLSHYCTKFTFLGVLSRSAPC
jgi:hypothetical protein